MIHIKLIYKDKSVVAFETTGHALRYVCSAVSMLTINTVNCIETFTSDVFKCIHEKSGGHIKFEFVSNISKESTLLIRAMVHGLSDAATEYPTQIKITEVRQDD